MIRSGWRLLWLSHSRRHSIWVIRPGCDSISNWGDTHTHWLVIGDTVTNWSPGVTPSQRVPFPWLIYPGWHHHWLTWPGWHFANLSCHECNVHSLSFSLTDSLRLSLSLIHSLRVSAMLTDWPCVSLLQSDSFMAPLAFTDSLRVSPWLTDSPKVSLSLTDSFWLICPRCHPRLLTPPERQSA